MKRIKEVLPVFVYLILLVVLIISSVVFSDPEQSDNRGELQNLSRDWNISNGEIADIRDVRANAGKSGVTITREFPDQIGEDAALCLISHNVTFRVLIDGRERYGFDSGENFTGYGYGDKRHIVPVMQEDSGKTVSIVLTSVFQKSGRGYIDEIYVGRPDAYLMQKARGAAFPAVLSVFIIFFGVLFIAIYLFIPNRQVLPYNIAALGIAVALLGLWCLNKTGFPQLFTEKTVMFRTLDYLAIFFAEYPVFCFVVSSTRQKSKESCYLFGAIWLLFLAAMFVLRFGLGADMHNIISLFYISYAIAILYMGYLIREDAGYCREHGLKRNNRHFLVGGILFAVCALLEAVSYREVERFPVAGGNFFRLGLCCFIFEMLLQFLLWWSTERVQQKRNRLITDALKHAVASDDPEKNICDMLAYLAAEYHAEHVYISEDRSGKASTTYEWYQKGARGRSEIRNTIREPLEMNGGRRGELVFDNIADDAMETQSMEEITETVSLLSTLFSQLLNQRDRNKELIRKP